MTLEHCISPPLMEWDSSPWACGAPGPDRTGCGGWAQQPPGSGSTVQKAGCRAGSRPCWSAQLPCHGLPVAEREIHSFNIKLNAFQRYCFSCGSLVFPYSIFLYTLTTVVFIILKCSFCSTQCYYLKGNLLINYFYCYKKSIKRLQTPGIGFTKIWQWQFQHAAEL